MTALPLLAFDTSTEALSVAVGWHDAAGRPRELSHEGVGGRESSASLIPAAMDLLGRAGLSVGQLGAVVFGRGPGSFTGLRTACAVAQGLAWGAGVPVLPVDTLLAVAEQARHQAGVSQVVALLDARMGEVYAATYAHDGTRWQTLVPPALCGPSQLQVPPGFALAGNAFTAHGALLPAGPRRVQVLPSAQALLRLAPRMLADGAAVPAAQALPLYIRDKVAQTTQERADERAARQPPIASANPS